MKVLVVSGIWPPDVGGPASHAPELATYLRGRGHAVEVVTTADREPGREAYPVRWVSRRIPVGARHARAAALIVSRALRADVVYCTGMVGRTALGAAIARTPLVLKLTSDPAYERSLRYGLNREGLDEFQRAGGLRIEALRRARDLALGSAAHVVCPSASLRDLALGWGLPPEQVTLLPNPVARPALDARDDLRRRHELDGPTLVFAGRLTPQKALDVALGALAQSGDVSLVLAGDGPDRAKLERYARSLGLDGRARFLGPRTRHEVFELLAAGDAALLSSSWENFPHMVVEALAVGTPVVATATGGVSEIVTDGENGLLVPPGDPEALADAIRRYFADEALRDRLRGAAVASIAEYAPERIYGRLEEILGGGSVTSSPRVLLVGRTRYRLPLDESLRRKFDALRARMKLRVLGSAPAGAPTGDETFALVPAFALAPLDGAVFRASLPVRIARELVHFRPTAVVAQGPHEGAAALLARSLVASDARVVVEVHGDWRTATRLYGSPARRALSPLADAAAAAALNGADAVRTVSAYTTRLVREIGLEPAAEFPAFMDLEPFLGPVAPLPDRPAALFVGVLERYKNVDGLAEAWRQAAPRVPEAELRLVGRGSLTGVVQALLHALPGQTSWRERVANEEVAAELDRATALVLPSRSEGMGRVVVEALCRGRPVVASRVGGIPDLVRDGENGLLVEPGDLRALADALVRVLSESELASRLAAAARASVEPWLATPEEYAASVHDLVVKAES